VICVNNIKAIESHFSSLQLNLAIILAILPAIMQNNGILFGARKRVVFGG
jgi:hypothetical protein